MAARVWGDKVDAASPSPASRSPDSIPPRSCAASAASSKASSDGPAAASPSGPARRPRCGSGPRGRDRHLQAGRHVPRRRNGAPTSRVLLFPFGARCQCRRSSRVICVDALAHSPRRSSRASPPRTASPSSSHTAGTVRHLWGGREERPRSAAHTTIARPTVSQSLPTRPRRRRQAVSLLAHDPALREQQGQGHYAARVRGRT